MSLRFSIRLPVLALLMAEYLTHRLSIIGTLAFKSLAGSPQQKIVHFLSGYTPSH